MVAFNRAIAKQLKQDIDDCLEQSQNTPVIRTVHALCLQIMGSDLRILLPHEVEAMLYDVLCTYPKLHEKYEKQSKAKQAFHNHVANLEDHIQLWQAVRGWLKRHHAQFISELSDLLLGELEGGDFADKTYQHVIVDEFQDLTPGEQKLFLKLRGEGGKFVALGDPRQSIYAFRGNAPEGLDKIIGELSTSSASTVKKHSMTECRRCPERIVKAAKSVDGII